MLTTFCVWMVLLMQHPWCTRHQIRPYSLGSWLPVLRPPDAHCQRKPKRVRWNTLPSHSTTNDAHFRTFAAGTLVGTGPRVGLSPNVSVPVVKQTIQVLADAIFRFLFEAPVGAVGSDLLSVHEDFVREALTVLQEPRGVPNFQGLARTSAWVGKVLETRTQV